MQTKHIYVLIHIIINGEVGTVKLFFYSLSPSVIILLTVSRRCFFCGYFLTSWLSCM